MYRNSKPRLLFICLTLTLTSSVVAIAGDVQQLVDLVSQPTYESFQLAVESMGMDSMGYRNRDFDRSSGASAGNLDTQSYLLDEFANMGLTVSTQGAYSNIVADLLGTTTPGRVFILAAHFDHLAGDRPGGDDNASGTAGVLEAARVLSQFQFESTLRFVAFNAEEDRMLGSRDYVRNLPEGEDLVGMINLDMILRPGFDSDPSADIDLDLGTITSHKDSVAWAQQFQQAAAAYAPSLTVDEHVFHISGMSDDGEFVRWGIPAFLVIENTADEIVNRGANAYWHTARDASDRLANDPSSRSGVTYDYAFVADTVRAKVGLLAEQAVLVPEPSTLLLAALSLVGLLGVGIRPQRLTRRGRRNANPHDGGLGNETTSCPVNRARSGDQPSVCVK